jgi:hypothetical protein
MHLFRIVVTCLVALSIQAAGSAATASLDTQSIIQRHIAAIGGEGALSNLRDFQLTLVYSEGSFSAQSSLAQARPYFRLVSVPAGPVTKYSVLEGYDGAAWEYYGDPGVVVRTVAGAAALSRRNAHQFIDPLVDAASNGTSLTFVGEKAFDGKNVFVISARYSDGNEDQIFIDGTTFLVDGLEQNIQFHAFAKNVPTHIVFDNYHPVGGVLMAFRSRQIDDVTGRQMDSSVTTSAHANVGLKPSDFAPPLFAPTPLQAAIAAIYQEREDPGAVLATYRDYRTAYGGSISSLDAIDFIGYQCLKMGDVKSAVALLAANVGDYPGAASAHFGFGRALASGEEDERARAEFKRALEIDPSYKRATDALATLDAKANE